MSGQVTIWRCPECGRTFGRKGQTHECAPALSLDEYFSTGKSDERPIYDAVAAHLLALGEVRVEPVSVGIFFKTSRVFASLRPQVRFVALSFGLSHTIDHPRITRKTRDANHSFHVVRLQGPDDVDGIVRDWLSESYQTFPA